jgi:hypothetical protein
MRRKITNETWEQIKTGYAAGINLREIARKMKMFCPPTDKTRKRCQKGVELGLLAVLAPLSVVVPVFLKSQRTAISGNSVATLCPAARAATDTASAQTRFD